MTKTPPQIRDRIKSFRRVKASKLIPHPQNWRRHPEAQTTALQGVLQSVGFVGASIVRELPDGRLQIIDGHLRANLAGDEKIPCLIVDLTEEEAKLILATFDPIGAEAETDEKLLAMLLAEVETESKAVQAMLDGLADGCLLPPGADGKEYDESCADDVKMTTCPKCGHEFPK